jgi:serine/threonine protein phosphatase PrpC
VREWLDEIRDKLTVIASRLGSTRRQLASTLVALMVSGEKLVTVQIGDSALVARRKNQWESLCWPQNGEYASTTFFVTDDPEPRLTVQTLDASEFDAFALFSDGLESLALQHEAMIPYPRFLDPMIRPVDRASHVGKLRPLSQSLAAYLDSPSVCDRTDDDKTLILLSRS